MSSLLLGLLAACAVLPVRAQTSSASYCSSDVCVAAIKSATNVTYTLSRPSAKTSSTAELGWMAIGFGSRMTNSPMVIVWPNSDSSVTLSQRQASGQVQPSVVSSPLALASLDTSASSVAAGSTSITFAVDDTSTSTTLPIIWAYVSFSGSTNPGSSSSSSSISMHDSAGSTSLVFTSSTSNSTSGGSGSTTSAASTSQPYTSRQKILIAHATLGGLAAMLWVPSGVLLARLLRAFWPRWCRAHWLVHVFLSFPFFAASIGLGIQFRRNVTPGTMLDSNHGRLGLALLILMVLQILLGTLIHTVRSSTLTFLSKPAQNWLHALVGVAILAGGWVQVFLGLDRWTRWSGMGAVPSSVRIAYWVLLGLFAGAYLLGLALLPRQFKADRARARTSSLDDGQQMMRDKPRSTSHSS